VVDALYVVLVLVPLKGELSDILQAVRAHGLRGFKSYWGFWNVLDWIAIVNGIIIVMIWLLICMAISSSNIQGVLKNDFKMTENVMSLEQPVIENLRDDLKVVLLLFRNMHLVMAANTIAIMLKFFKAFQANARLQVVTKTLMRAFVDIVHFMVVFMAAFNGFVVTGHILLGGDILHFNSFGASFNTAFLCLLGDFGWYSDLTEKVEPLASGLPYFVVSLWFWSFIIFALQILLNMLLAIIMDNYAAVTGELMTMADAPTLVQQCHRYWTRKMMARKHGFTPLDRFFQELTGDKDPHPDSFVSHESMMQAFPTMKTEQATFLMKWLQKDADATAEKVGDDELLGQVKKCQALMRTIAQNMHAVSLCVMRCDSRIQNIEKQRSTSSRLPVGSMTPAPEPFCEPAAEQTFSKGINRQLETQQRVMKELCEQLSKQKSSSDTMTKALTDFSSLMQAQGQADTSLLALPQITMRTRNPMQMPSCCSTSNEQCGAAPVSLANAFERMVS